MVAGFLAESVREPREPPQAHARGQVEPFHPRRADFGFGNGPANDRLGQTCYGPR